MDIFRYEVREDISDNPIYGKSRIIFNEDECKTMDNAIALATEYAGKNPDKAIYVWANQYVSEKNVEKHFPLQSHYIWATWLSTMQSLAMQKFIKEKEKGEKS